MPIGNWRDEMSGDVECAIGLNIDCGGTAGVHRVRDAVLAALERHVEAAYKRGLMAGRSQTGYRTTRKKKEETWRTDTAGAASRTPVSTTEDVYDPDADPRVGRPLDPETRDRLFRELRAEGP